MIPKINHILYTTDLSGGVRNALGYTVALADAFEASFHRSGPSRAENRL